MASASATEFAALCTPGRFIGIRAGDAIQGVQLLEIAQRSEQSADSFGPLLSLPDQAGGRGQCRFPFGDRAEQ